MSATMVTARIDESKKMRVNAILKKNGKTPSGVINELYDIIIQENGLPWENQQKGIATMSKNEIASALDFIRDIQLEDSRFSTMSDEEIKEERLKTKGLL